MDCKCRPEELASHGLVSTAQIIKATRSDGGVVDEEEEIQSGLRLITFIMQKGSAGLECSEVLLIATSPARQPATVYCNAEVRLKRRKG